MCDFFNIAVYKHGVGTYAAHALKRYYVFYVSAEKTAQPSGTGDYEGFNAAGAFVEIYVDDAAQYFAVA